MAVANDLIRGYSEGDSLLETLGRLGGTSIAVSLGMLLLFIALCVAVDYLAP